MTASHTSCCCTPSTPKVPCFKNIFAQETFNLQVMRQRLPSDIYKAMEGIIQRGEKLPLDIANVVANSMKDWAIENGATHFTHWFQPMTGTTAEKHDTFFSPNEQGVVVSKFSGKTLICGEPDASSFPSGGIRSTFEARGYTAWDPTVPAFLVDGREGKTLHIPSVFYSYTGEALDRKIPLLRSIEALSKSTVRVLHLFGKTEVKYARPMVGAEQEYFLVDAKLAAKRPDLLMTGRTLVGAASPKGQELEDQYFGATPKRVMDFMQDLEVRLFRLGIPIHTRHNEVAPGQFELAPLYEEANIATDHNMLTMNILRATAQEHGFVCLLHEKPFAGVNGSGKHNNWSIGDSEGNNLLDPGDTPLENAQFLVFLAATLRAVHKHADVLRLGTIGAGNDHRLGANEAPPAIISAFLGDLLTDVIETIVAGGKELSSKKEGIEIGVSALPVLARDYSDRNRTSPFAFTGNKFEFRTVGSSQSISPVNIALNSAVSCALEDIADSLEALMKKGKNIHEALQEFLPKIFKEHMPAVFNGNGYSEEWKEEAAARGLLNLTNTVEALKLYHTDAVKEVFIRTSVLSEREIMARQEILFDMYAKTICLEAKVMVSMMQEQVLPAVQATQIRLASLVTSTKQVIGDANMEEELFKTFRGKHLKLQSVTKQIATRVLDMDTIEDVEEQAEFALEYLTELMQTARKYCDELEQMVDDRDWQMPKYAALMWTH